MERIEEAVEKTKVTDRHPDSVSLTPPPHVLTSLALFPGNTQVKKSTKKVRVTVKPHLLFRVSTFGFPPIVGWLIDL